MSINLVQLEEQHSERQQMIQGFDQFFKTSEKTRQQRNIRDNRSATPLLQQRSLLDHCRLQSAERDQQKDDEAQRAR